MWVQQVQHVKFLPSPVQHRNYLPSAVMNTSEHGYEALNGAFNPEALHCIKTQKEALCISRVCMGSHHGIHIRSTWSMYLEGHRPHLFLSKPNITAEITQEPIICLVWAQPGAKLPQFPVAWDFWGHCGWLSAHFALSWDVEEAQPSPHLHGSHSVAKLSRLSPETPGTLGLFLLCLLPKFPAHNNRGTDF